MIRDGRRRRNLRRNDEQDRPSATPRVRKKGRKERIPRQILLALMAPCVAVLYGIAMAIHFFIFQKKRNQKQSTSGIIDKEEQRNRLQQKQQAYLQERKNSQKHRIRHEVVNHRVIDGNSSHHEPTSRKTVHFRRKYPRMIYFLHIHKSAGSFFCKQAFRNRISADYQRNCNVRDDQRCCSSTDDFSAQSQIDFARNAPYDLVATEKELPELLLPDYYDYVVSLRDSKDRYESHWNHLVRMAEETKEQSQTKLAVSGSSSTWFSSWFGHEPTGPSRVKRTEINDPIRYKNPLKYWKRHNSEVEYDPTDPQHYSLTVRDASNGRLHPVGNFTKWMEGQPDNYNVRMVCGARCWNVSKFQITRDLFEYTLERLWFDFSHILFVEDMEDSFGRFAAAYGWDPSLSDFPKPPRSGTNQKSWHPYATVLDNALYELAKRKAKQKDATNISRESWKHQHEPFENQALVDEYFWKGPSKHCSNACCGYCSVW